VGLTSRLKRPKVGIVGGTGRMGSWFADLLEGAGSEVFRVGRRTELTAAEIARECDVVVISVPVADTVKVIREIGPLVAEDGLLMDLTSVKQAPLEAMLKYSQSQVLGVHPLFGPEVKSNSAMRVVVVPGRGEIGQRWISDIFLRTGFRVTVLDAEKHDRMMGLIQGANHFSTLAFALCISRCGIELEDLVNGSTQTFCQRLDRIRSMMDQPAGLFGSLLMDNPAAGEFIEQYLESVDRLIQITRDGDRQAFEKLFASLQKGFGNSLAF
jgi:prephenate dehydrogenase